MKSKSNHSRPNINLMNLEIESINVVLFIIEIESIMIVIKFR